MTVLVDRPSTTIDDFVAKIRDWYERDHDGFRHAYDAAIRNVVPPPCWPDDPVYFNWQYATIDTLCEFFEEWYKTLPTVKTGLDYIEKFSWINYENDAGMAFVTFGPGFKMTADFTNLQGLQMDEDTEQAAQLIKRWKEELGKKRMSDYIEKDWRTFNQFFIRDVKPERRPIDAANDDSVVVAPADCVINMIVDKLTMETPIPVKTVTMNVKQLLDGSAYAERFTGGTAVSCILMPDTYHWYHTPVAGDVVESDDGVGGVYYGMRNFPALLNNGNVGYNYDYQMFDRFRRGYVVIKTKYLDKDGKPDGEGYVGVVPVGLNSIASVEFLEKFKKSSMKPVRVKKGEKIGNFQYGGSLNILLFEKGRFPAMQLLQGQRIGVLEQVERTEKLFNRAQHTPALRHLPFASRY